MTDTPTQRSSVCYIEQFAHALPHRDEASLRPCGHWACDPHTITYYGTGEERDQREGDYCMVCYELTFPGRCPDKVLRAAIAASRPTGERQPE
jgi:hypothetical protein